MLIWGQTILVPYLKGLGFIVYWGFCFLFTIGAIFIALLDVRAVRQRVREEQAHLLRRTIEEIERGKEEQRKSE